MLLISCPWCGEREETEFSYGGEADLVLPPSSVDDAEWARFLFFRANPAGAWRENWCHAAGCRRWFVATRDTRTHMFLTADNEPSEVEHAAP